MKQTEKQRISEFLQVYFIMGSVNCTRAPEEVLKEAIDGGITMFQFREKGNGSLQGQRKLELALKLKQICHNYNIPFIVNDDIDLALKIDADGVHIGQEDESVELVRKRIGDRILGVSVHQLSEAEEAINKRADYFGVGPVYPTSTKTDAKPVQGVSFIEELRTNGFQVPIVGIGGISANNASAVTHAGADGVSVITAITNANNIQTEVKKLKSAVRKGLVY
ncbi:thiamine phosphate synthase [Mesobacillus maritimus]|uniref:thiamine phosphate synthase n=1 Tax=Mesobacillus maritimus TaxID=1643336 RepID=UPI00203DCE84|nr:thiamine phosphate synthase [Mesobacillus maritimus]MCM3584201.1 thiamine phosphate synthase [Mesobacillus maritimus]MCM3669337.1 thiamine phosphate synthase [Mesobacillus maritimus]